MKMPFVIPHVLRSILLVLIVVLFFTACNDYQKKDKYVIEVGETIEIYYSTNSCCQFCVANYTELDNINLVEDKTIDPGPKDCQGCNYIAAFLFEGSSIGIDTVELKVVTAKNEKELLIEPNETTNLIKLPIWSTSMYILSKSKQQGIRN